MAALNEASTARFSASVALLFEPAPRFAGWLAAARPFRSDQDLLTAAARVARRMPEADQLQLINAHPRLGARQRLSSASQREQGSADDAVDRELAQLNAAYEATFGFRYLVFVRGRSRAELLPELRAALARDRDAELRRALDDTLAIAADRLRFLRSQPGRMA